MFIVFGTLYPLLLAVSLAASPQQIKSDYWDSQHGLYRLKVPVDWSVQQRTSGFFEDVRLGPKKEPTVSLTILSRRHYKPMTSIDNDRHLRTVIKDYRKRYKDLKIEKGPNRVPVGNEDSWSYLLIYNTSATDGSKISVRETISYVSRRLGDMAYIHHIIIGRMPLPVAFKFSAKLSKLLTELEFIRLKMGQVDPSAKPLPANAPADAQEDAEEEDGASPSPAPGGSPAPKASPQ